MVNISVLKIESDSGVLLASRNAKQELSPIEKNTINKNINSDIIKIEQKRRYKCVVETKDDVYIDGLLNSSFFKIYSILRVLSKSDPPIGTFVEDSVEKLSDAVMFRPIFDMTLVNFNCRADSNGNQIWRLEFEET